MSSKNLGSPWIYGIGSAHPRAVVFLNPVADGAPTADFSRRVGRDIMVRPVPVWQEPGSVQFSSVQFSSSIPTV
ncbi:hypothetical protein [Streptomyces sp. NPDC088178]|uniref:hypothetical protein n=1 Tax=Streptomyces sp. NPDC088178 TaxID=3365836 RepID=UPI00381B927F